MKPYDPKKSVWVPNKEEGGFDEGLLLDVQGDKANVKVGWETKVFKESDITQVNPPKMEKIEDVTYMTYLNDASVLWNLKTRYVAQLIYVSLFDIHFISNKQNSIRSTKNLYLLEAARCEIDRSDRE